VIGRDDRSLGHESVADVVDDHAEPFERANTQQDEIAGLSEDYFVGGFKAFGREDRVADVARDGLVSR
jgi:hypothetical protein